AHGLIDVDPHAVADHLLEPGQLRSDAVRSVLEVREDVVPAFVRDGGVGDVGVDFGDCHRRAGHGEARVVEDVSEESALDRLCCEETWCGQDEGEREDRREATAHCILLESKTKPRSSEATKKTVE